MVATFELRRGNTGSAHNFVELLEETLSMFGNKKVGLVCLDSGFCPRDIMNYLKQKQLNYLIAPRFTHPIQQLIEK